MLNAVATINQFAASDETSTGLLLGSLTLVACLLTIILAMTSPEIADSIALLGTMERRGGPCVRGVRPPDKHHGFCRHGVLSRRR